MQTMEQSLADLTMRRIITPEVAFSRSSRADQLLGLLERAGFSNLAAFGSGGSPQSGDLRLAGKG